MKTLAVLSITCLLLSTGCASDSTSNTDTRDSDGRGATRERRNDGSGRSRNLNSTAEAKVLSIMYEKDQEEVRIGRLAQSRANSAEAKRYADMLVNDHGDHAPQVARVAKSAGITLWDRDAVKNELDRMRGNRDSSPDPMQTLQPLSGAQFDRTFGQLMADGHRELIQTIETARRDITNSEVIAFVDKTLTTLRHHEEMARSLARQ